MMWGGVVMVCVCVCTHLCVPWYSVPVCVNIHVVAFPKKKKKKRKVRKDFILACCKQSKTRWWEDLWTRLVFVCTFNLVTVKFFFYCSIFNFVFRTITTILLCFVTLVPDHPSEGSVTVWFWNYLFAFCSPLLCSQAPLLLICSSLYIQHGSRWTIVSFPGHSQLHDKIQVWPGNKARWTTPPMLCIVSVNWVKDKQERPGNKARWTTPPMLCIVSVNRVRQAGEAWEQGCCFVFDDYSIGCGTSYLPETGSGVPERSRCQGTAWAQVLYPGPAQLSAACSAEMQKQLGGSEGCSPRKFWNFWAS